MAGAKKPATAKKPAAKKPAAKKPAAKKPVVAKKREEPVSYDDEGMILSAVEQWDKQQGTGGGMFGAAKKGTAQQKRDRADFVDREMNYRYQLKIRPKKEKTGDKKQPVLNHEEEMTWLIRNDIFDILRRKSEEEEEMTESDEERILKYIQEEE